MTHSSEFDRNHPPGEVLSNPPRGIHRPGVTQPMHVLKVKLVLPVRSNLTVALTTVYRSAFTGLERYFGVFATLGTCYGEHLALRRVAVAATSITL